MLEIHDELAAQIQNSTEVVEYIDGVSTIAEDDDENSTLTSIGKVMYMAEKEFWWEYLRILDFSLFFNFVLWAKNYIAILKGNSWSHLLSLLPFWLVLYIWMIAKEIWWDSFQNSDFHRNSWLLVI